jgi:hypothetical protein
VSDDTLSGGRCKFSGLEFRSTEEPEWWRDGVVERWSCGVMESWSGGVLFL